ncbi:MAG: hypothetical protein ABI810_10485 [Sphingomonas bacterium]
MSRAAIGTALSALEREALIKRRYGSVEVSDRAALRGWVERRTMLSPI